MLLLILFLSLVSCLPVLDNSWDNFDCPGCICTPPYDQCLCPNNCPNVTNYFYIINIDPFDSVIGEISHDINITEPAIANIEYTFPMYAGARFMLCTQNSTIVRCCYALKHETSMSIDINPGDYRIWFNFYIKPSRYSIWQITSLSWIKS